MRKLNLREVISTAIAIVMFFFFVYDRYSTNLSVKLDFHITIKEGIGDMYLNVGVVNYSHKAEYLKQPDFCFVELNDTVSFFHTHNYAFNDFPLKIEYGQEINIECAINDLFLDKLKAAYCKNRKSEIKAIIKNTLGKEFSSNSFTVEKVLLEYGTIYDNELYNQISDVPVFQENIAK